jgi:hypothetical protein
MAAQKFLTLISGIKNWVSAITSSAGAADEGKIPGLNVNGQLDETFFPAGLGRVLNTFPASENLADGDPVNKWDDGGTMKVRKADCSGGEGKRSHGFVLSSYTTGQTAVVYALGELNNHLSGKTPGAKYWLGTAGTYVDTPPTTETYIIQYMGIADSASAIQTEASEPVVIGA